MAHGCCVIPPSKSGWFGEQMERAQTFSVTLGERCMDYKSRQQLTVFFTAV